ncbi:MAG: response regulator transcription factor [Terriglobales bacterium]
MPERRHVLLVDDEPQITRMLRTAFSTQPYDIRVANDGETALELIKDWPPDLVITDLMMPNLDGIELCRRLRAVSQVPIIVLSVRGQEQMKVRALDAGADDYVTKPFNTKELLARVRAQLRRSPIPEPVQTVLELGDFRIDLEGHDVCVRGQPVHLTPKEFDVLVHLARHANKVLSHRTLLIAVWGANSVDQPQYLHVVISQLRKKLDPQDSSRYIKTEPWVGYRFEPGE